MAKSFFQLFLLTFLPFSSSIYFTIDHHQRCLYEEVTKNTVFLLSDANSVKQTL